ncbi:MAG: HD domain-containing protein [Gemmobacter sp.]
MERLMAACAFAARHHTGQTRKGASRAPYVNHVIEVAARVATSPAACEDTVIAALLHDTVEDTRVSEADLISAFGLRIAAIVMEVTDDKRLDQPTRKALQASTIGTKSPQARWIKIADQTANLADLAAAPPDDWDAARCAGYVDWACRVVDGARGTDAALEAAFHAQAAETRSALARGSH